MKFGLALPIIALAACSPAGGGGGGGAAKVSYSAEAPDTQTYASSEAQYKAYSDKANGGRKLEWAKLPDWSGIWTRRFEGPPFAFDAKAGPSKELPPAYGASSAQLTPAYQAMWRKKVAEVAKGVEWDSLSYCLPAGFPRWLTEPFLKEFIVTPAQTWMINEQQSEARRVYTDGRGHVPEDEAYPLWEGDSIGFWDGDTLVVHTNNLRGGQYQRGQPDYSDKVTTVERIRKISDDTIEDTVTVYDPESLTKPWRTTFHYDRVKTPNLRVNMWSCNENNNVVKTDSGASNFVLPGEKGYKDPNTFTKPPAE
ncbi:MAG TPA: hypothetical protein VL460_06355 [Caulobacteraceae bacterium]|jgi:hypothetical protein|nr:hypothetical protein [Caulobacteraceae bacterium]